MIRRLALLPLMLCATPATAQGPYWNPSAEYITAGQDEPGYRAWVAQAGWRPVYVKAFHDYLVHYGVGGVAPTWQLLRTATDWHKCGAQPFEVPPSAAWPNIVAALRYVGTYITPRIGPVEVVSVYRNPRLNACANGAPESTHRYMGAVDMVPLRPISREALMTQLCLIHRESGERNYAGLGLLQRAALSHRRQEISRMGHDRGQRRLRLQCRACRGRGAIQPRGAPLPAAAVVPVATDPLAPKP